MSGEKVGRRTKKSEGQEKKRACGERQGKNTNLWTKKIERRGDKRTEVNTYLMGAPRDWAGFRRMVMVVSVSFSGASDSYSGIMGADGFKKRDCPI